MSCRLGSRPHLQTISFASTYEVSAMPLTPSIEVSAARQHCSVGHAQLRFNSRIAEDGSAPIESDQRSSPVPEYIHDLRVQLRRSAPLSLRTLICQPQLTPNTSAKGSRNADAKNSDVSTILRSLKKVTGSEMSGCLASRDVKNRQHVPTDDSPEGIQN